MIRLYDESDVHFIGVKSQTALDIGLDRPGLSAGGEPNTSSRATTASGCVRSCATAIRVLLDGEEQLGIIEPLLAIQSRINETTFDVGRPILRGFKQRYITDGPPRTKTKMMR